MADTDALVAALEALTREVALLRQAVAGHRVEAPVVPAPPVALAAAVAMAPAPVAPAPLDERPQTPAERIARELHVALGHVMAAAGRDDEEEGFQAFLAMIHSERLDTPRAEANLREFTWKSLRRRLPSYLVRTDDPASFAVERLSPDVPKVSDERIRVFVRSPGRSPVPATFVRDPAAGGAWRLAESSL